MIIMEVYEESTIFHHQRSTEDVKSIIKLAKLNEKKLTNVSQAIYFDSTEENDDLKLLELNDHLLAAINDGKTLQFKGGLNEKVVLCTDTKTFDVKEAGISNSILLIPNLNFAQSTTSTQLKSPESYKNTSLEKSLNSSTDSVDDDEIARQLENRWVKKNFHEYFECREVKPKFRKLYDLLQLTRYSGPENEHYIENSMLFTYDQLLNTLQCSQIEFDEGLRTYHGIEIDNRIRILDVEYEYRLLSIMIGIIIENSWSYKRIDRNVTLSSILDTIAPSKIVEQLFDLYTIKINEENDIEYSYDEEMVCRTIALHLLKQGMKYHYDDFMSSWQNILPEGMIVDEKYLSGIGIVGSDSSKIPCVRALIETNLSTNLIERLRILFNTRERWSLEQIQPYIEYFSTPQLSITSILAKHARSISENGKRIYVSKHGV